MEDSESTHTPPAEDGEHLDREHHARLARIARNDTKQGRDEAARDESGRLTEEIQELTAKREALGNVEHVDACERCKWLPYAHRLWLGSRLAWILDAVLWLILWGSLWLLWIRYYKDSPDGVPGWVYFPGGLAVPIFAILCAKTAKGLGQHVAVTRLTDPNSVNDTVDGQVAFAGKAATGAGVFLLVILALLFFSPPSWTSWSTYVSGLLGFGANIALGLSAGVGGNAAQLLMKPAERDDIECQIDMKKRTRRRLQKFFLGVLLAVGLAAEAGRTALAAGDTVAIPDVQRIDPLQDFVLVKAVDVSDSVDPDQRERGIAAMIDRAPEQARRLGVHAILVIKFSDEVLLADMVWVPVPQRPPVEDCNRVSPQFSVTKSVMQLSPMGAMEARETEVQACLARRESGRMLLAEQDRRIYEQLRAATRTTPRRDGCTRIVSFLRKFVTRPYVRAIEVLTDGIDNSGVPVSTLTVPDGVALTLIITRPNPKRQTPSLDDVLAAAEVWDRIDGVSVTTVSEYSGFSNFAEAR